MTLKSGLGVTQQIYAWHVYHWNLQTRTIFLPLTVWVYLYSLLWATSRKPMLH